MRNAIRIPTPIQLGKLTRIMQIRGTDVFVHWSVLLIIAIMIAGIRRRPAVTLAGILAYLGVFLLHEAGHLVMAQRKHCDVFSIELYPVFGVTRFQVPWSLLDHCMIAWGGVIAQAIVALPVVIWIAVLGYTRFEALNAALVLLGPFSVAVAALNLLPVGPLDGSIAWRLVPESIHRVRNRGRKNSPPYGRQ
jgi:Zn-dependent protease